MILRQNYNAIKAKYKKEGKGDVRLTQSTLILIQTVSSAKDTYLFPILENDTKSAIQPEEIRLNMNDEFIANQIGFYVGADVTVSGTSKASKRLFTYAPVELSSAYMGIEDVWNGQLSILVNKIQFLDHWDLKKHNIVTQTQYKNSSVGLPYATQANINFKMDGTYPLQPMITLSGAKKNTIEIDLPHAVSASSADWTGPDAAAQTVNMNKLYLIFRGLLAQNASKFQSK